MNFAKYIESRFMRSHLILTHTKAPEEFAVYRAIQVYQWVVIQVMTAVHLFTVPCGYLMVLLHLKEAPPSALNQASEARLAYANEQMAKQAAEKGITNLEKARNKTMSDFDKGPA